jgi:membrane protease YdiL (CAAX protease family)
MSVTAFCLILVLLFYVGSVVQRWDIVWGMVITQWGLLLLPVMLLVKIGGLDMKETLMLRMPSPRSLLAALVVGCSVWLVLGTAATLLQNAILPAPPSFDREMQRAFGQTDLEMTALVTILVFSLSPGICEEVLFRGLILSGFRNTLRKWPAILLTAAMFGVFHISIYRIMPTAIVGIAVTYVVWQTRSIWCGVIVHALNNGIALLVTKYKPGWIEGVVGVGEHSPNIPVLAAFTIALVAGFAMLPKDGAEDREPQMHADSRA